MRLSSLRAALSFSRPRLRLIGLDRAASSREIMGLFEHGALMVAVAVAAEVTLDPTDMVAEPMMRLSSLWAALCLSRARLRLIGLDRAASSREIMGLFERKDPITDAEVKIDTKDVLSCAVNYFLRV